MSDRTRRVRAIRALVTAHLRASYREPGGLFWTYGFPIIMSLVLGLAFRARAPEPARIAVAEGPRAAWVVEKLSGGRDVVATATPLARAENDLRVGKVDALLLPEADGSVTYRFDETRAEARLARALADRELQRAAGATPAVRSKDELVTEIGARYIDFLLPGLLGLSLMSTGFWGIGFSLADMRGKKLLKRIVATPMRRSDFLASFLIVRVVLLGIELPPLLVFARLLFSISVRGSPVAFLVVVLLGSLLFATMGLALASRAENPQIVSGLINVLSFPMYLCSGVFFSAARFPERVQPVLRLLPLSALNEALRAVMIDGAGLHDIARQLAVMGVWLGLSFALAVRLFKWR